MKGSSGGVTLAQIWNELVTKAKTRLALHDEFNRLGDDTDVWTSGADTAGTFARVANEAGPTIWRLLTDNNVDDDSYVHGDTCIYNKQFSIQEDGFGTVTYETRLSLSVAANISALWGLFVTGLTGYQEILNRCAQFFADPAVNANYNCRSYEAAEEQTDSGIPIDTDPHDFKIVWSAASVLFYIDDVLVATHVTRVPTYRLLPGYLIRTEAVAAISMDIDNIHVVVS